MSVPAARQKSLAPLPDADKAKAQQALASAAADGGGGGVAKVGGRGNRASAVELAAPPPPAPTPGKPLAVESGKKGAPGLEVEETPDDENEDKLVVKASGPSLKRVCLGRPALAFALCHPLQVQTEFLPVKIPSFRFPCVSPALRCPTGPSISSHLRPSGTAT